MVYKINYEQDLTRRALEHYNIASRQKSAGAMSADIAAVRLYGTLCPKPIRLIADIS